MTSYQGQRVTIMGLGTRAGGVGMARYFVDRGAIVTVTDGKSESDLASSIEDLRDLPITWALGSHPERLFTPEGADLVVRNPAVRRNSPYLALARANGVPIDMEMSIFIQACPAPVIGVTGTKGKTSTSTLTAEILRAWRPTTVLAGNMGVSAVSMLDRIDAETPVVLEISNWQLEGMAERGVAPQIAVLTNISEDHLDTYDGFEEYAETKRSIARHSTPEDTLVLNGDDSLVWQAATSTDARIVWFGSERRSGDGVWLRDRTLVWEIGGSTGSIDLPDRPVFAGRHQHLNAAAAIAASIVRGADESAVRAGLERYQGVRDRSEVVGEIDGVLYVNDTSATAPVAAIAALDAWRGRRVHVIAGGFDKQLSLDELGSVLAADAATVTLLDGTATPRLMAAIAAAGGSWSGPFDSMKAAIAAAAAAAVPGDVVLLSPGCASFGLFRDEFDRGDKFRAAVAALASERALAR